MKALGVSIPIGLGDIIYLKGAFEKIKSQYSCIGINFNRNIINSIDRDPKYNTFLDDIGQLFFSEYPYKLNGNYPFYEHILIYTNFGILPQKPELSHLLCKGNPLQLDSEYIVITTKLRYFPRGTFDSYSPILWNIVAQLTKKYKLVVLGERQVEMNQEYQHHTSQHIYSIYESIKNNVASDKLVDLTIPALGITSPTLVQIQQDCLIMNQAKFIITLGVGGNFCMATAVGNTIGYRVDEEPIADIVFNQEYPNAVVTKSWDRFIQKLKEYI